jgi:multidrug efflux system outer membrane protein
MNKLYGLLLAGLVGGCSLAPDYTRPTMPIAPVFPGVIEASAAVLPDWQGLFTDPRLKRLITLALEENRDLRVAALRVEEARAQYRIQRAEQWPSLSATGSGTRQRSPAEGQEMTAGGAAANRQISSLYSVGVGLSAYELDVFGRVRNLKDAALSQYLSLDETRRSVELSLIAEVATAYLNQRAAHERLGLTRQTLENRHRGLELTRQRFEYGLGSELDVSQAVTLVETAESDLAALQRSVAQSDNTLALLIGSPLPDDLPPARPLTAQGLDVTLPPGLPAELLTRRPDIQAAESRLRATYANIGAARAAFFPRISLTANTGFSSSELSSLFNGASRSWMFMPQIELPIFNAGQIRAQRDVAEVRKGIGIAEYELSIQTAFREVADELVARPTLHQQLDAQRRLNASTANSVQLAEQRYRQGLDGFLVLLDSQRTAYEAQTTLIDATLEVGLSQVRLFRSLGGGWSTETQTEQRQYESGS